MSSLHARHPFPKERQAPKLNTKDRHFPHLQDVRSLTCTPLLLSATRRHTTYFIVVLIFVRVTPPSHASAAASSSAITKRSFDRDTCKPLSLSTHVYRSVQRTPAPQRPSIPEGPALKIDLPFSFANRFPRAIVCVTLPSAQPQFWVSADLGIGATVIWA